MTLLVQRDGEVGGDEEQDYSALPNLLQLSFYLEQSGIGLSSTWSSPGSD